MVNINNIFLNRRALVRMTGKRYILMCSYDPRLQRCVVKKVYNYIYLGSHDKSLYRPTRSNVTKNIFKHECKNNFTGILGQ